MAKQLMAASIAAPAFYGLNTQESGVTLQEGFALHANNCVIDKYGRLGARKGWITQSTSLDGTADANDGIDLVGVTSFKDIAGTDTFISWSDDTFYKGITALTTLTPDLDTGDTITEGNWQTATLNDHHYFFQRGYEPLVYTNESGEQFDAFSQHPHNHSGTPFGNTVLGAYGRLWVADTTADKTKVWFSDLLDGSNFHDQGAGSLDILSVFTQGADEIVALGAHNGFLIIFCKNNIVIYDDASNFQDTSLDVSTLNLVEVIEGVGCIARDSVQNTGEDILFLSNTGVRSLNRTIQEKSQPLRDISKNVRDDILQAVGDEDLDKVKSVYSPTNAFYLLSFPTSTQTFCFDTRAPMQDGSFRITLWPTKPPKAFVNEGTDLYFAEINGVAKYDGYQDNGVKYDMEYFSNYFDLEMPNVNKIVKKLAATTVGATGQTFTLKVGYEYSPIYYSYTFTLDTGTVYEYGVAEYGPAPSVDPYSISWDAGGIAPDNWVAGSGTSVSSPAEYSGSVLIDNQQASTGGAGNIIQIGFTTEINGAPMSLQKISIYAKQGKVL